VAASPDAATPSAVAAAADDDEVFTPMMGDAIPTGDTPTLLLLLLPMSNSMLPLSLGK
jgi:hypothetical protein